MGAFNRTTAIASAFLSLGLLLTAPASASGLFDSMPSLGPKTDTDTKTMSADDLERNLSSLDTRFSLAMREMLMAQSFTLAALGDKAQADQLSSEASSLQGKNDINTVARSITMSEDACKEIDSKTASASVMSGESKSALASAVPHYAVGIVQAAQLPQAYREWIANAQAAVNGLKSNPMTAILGGGALVGDLRDVITVTTNLPDLISTWGSTTKNFLKFARGNHVDTGDLASKI